MTKKEKPETKLTSGKVAKVIDDYTIIINRGSQDGVKNGQRFLVYAYGEEISDPDTNKSLGRLEIVRGTGRVTHLQLAMATVRSDMKTKAGRIIRRTKETTMGFFYSNIFRPTEEEETLPAEATPFEGVMVGDYVKPV